ncbi:MAG: ComEA family DNA-binding protein [Acidimicrobiales bacterium]
MLDSSTSFDDREGDGALRRPPPPRTWRERIEGLADATGSSPRRIVGGAVVAALAAVAALVLLRPPADPPEVSLPFASTTRPAPVAPTTMAMPETLVVHVAGAVAVPGIHELPTGARVADAIAVAGGLALSADESRINLAAPVTDGQRVYVLAAGEASPPPVAGGGSAAGASGDPEGVGPVDLNSADAAALDELPGVGPATATAILEHRAKVGAFSSVDQLLDVPGIGEAKLEALRDLVTV